MPSQTSVYDQLLKQQIDQTGRFTRSKVFCDEGFVPVHSVIIRALCPDIQVDKKRCRTNGLDFIIKLAEHSLFDVASAFHWLYSGKANCKGLFLSESEMATLSPNVKAILMLLGLSVHPKPQQPPPENTEERDEHGQQKPCSEDNYFETAERKILKLVFTVGGKTYDLFLGNDGMVKRGYDEHTSYSSVEAMQEQLKDLCLQQASKSPRSAGACD